MSQLTAEERETIISWSDDEHKGMFFIHTTQLPMMRRLLKNPQLELLCYHHQTGEEPYGIDGYLPLRCLTIRTKLVKRKPLTDEEKRQRAEYLRKAREVKLTVNEHRNPNTDVEGQG